MNFILFIIIGILAGWIAEQVMGRHHGLLTNLLVGIVGAVLGGWLAGILHLQIGDGFIGSLVVATVGAILLLAILGLVFKRQV